MSKYARMLQLELWTVLFAEFQKGSNTQQLVVAAVAVVHMHLIYFLLFQSCLVYVIAIQTIAIANSEINLTTDVEYLGSYDENDLSIDFIGLMILFVTNSWRL